MRKILAFVPAWALFWAGDLVSRLFLRWDATAFMYPVYNRLMLWSVDVNDWGCLDVWGQPDPRVLDQSQFVADESI